MGALTQLRTGDQVHTAALTTTMIALEEVFNSNPIAFYEAHELAKNPQHTLFGNTGDVLNNYALVQGNHMSATVRSIILAATQGEGAQLRLTHPTK